MRTTTTSNRNRNLVSAVLLNYISYDQTIQCVTDLLAQEYSALDIVIVDNRSPNGAFKHLANAFRSEDRVSLIETPENLG